MKKSKKVAIIFFIFNALVFFFQLLGKKIYAPLIPEFQQSLKISSAQAGFLITAGTLGYGISRFPSGILTDIIGCKKTIIYSGFLMGIFYVGVGFAPNYLFLTIITFIMGISTGLYITAGYTLAVLLGKNNREATFTALLENFGVLAATIAPLIVVLYIEILSIGWRKLFFSVGIFIIIINLLFIYFSRDKNIQNKDDYKIDYKRFKKELSNLFSVFKNRQLVKFIIWATVVGGFGFFSILAFQSFIPKLLVTKGYSFSKANHLFSLIFIIGLIAKPFVGWIADKIGTKRILVIILILNGIFYFLFTSNIGLIGIYCSILVFGITFSSHNTLINSYVLRLFPDEYKGTGFGLFSTLYTGIYSMGPFIIGYFVDKLNIMTGMRISVVGIVVAIPVLILFNYFFPNFKRINYK